MNKVIASFHAPKQRMTVDFEVILIERNDGTFSTHDREHGTNNCMTGHYDFPSFADGWADFTARVQRELARGSVVYEIDA